MARDTAHDYEVRKAIDDVVESSRKLLDTEKRPIEHGQHPKQHGCVRARFVIAKNLGDAYRRGLFQEEKVYDAWIRFSNGAQHDDRKPDAHGMAVKLMGVEGRMIPGNERDAATHDFVMVDSPNFFLRDAAEYSRFSELLLKAKGKAPSSLYDALGFVASGPVRSLLTLLLLSLFRWRLPTFLRLIKFASKRISSPLATRYWSATPYKFGDTCMKFSAVPAEFPGGTPAEGPGDDSYEALVDFLSPAVAAQTVSTPPNTRLPDYLRHALSGTLSQRGAVFLFQVQLFRGDRITPIDDPSVEWREETAPFHTVARIWVPKQVGDTNARMAFGESLSFSPWHALVDHEPLGEINAVRRDVYPELSSVRHRLNGVDEREPNADDPDPDELPPRWGSDRSAFCHVLQAELDLIQERRRHVESPSADRDHGRHRRLSVVGSAEQTERALDGPLGPGTAGPAAAGDADSLTREARLRAAALHTTGLALTGKGASGATFAVGFLEGLASLGLIGHLDYLSANSGGGYAAGWLAAWLKREGSDPENIERQLAPSRIAQARATRQYLAEGEVVDPEPEPLRHLRSYAPSLESGAGALSTDSWILILTWARNVIIHLFVLLPLFVLSVAGARLIVALYGLLGRLGELDQLAAQFDSRLRGPIFVLGVLALGILLVTGAVALGSALSSIAGSLRDRRRPRAEAREQTDSTDPVAVMNRRIVTRLLAGALLLSLCLPPIWRGLGEQLENVSFGSETGAVLSMRTVVDVVRAHFMLISWPNFLTHAFVLGAFWAYWTSRRSQVAEPARRQTYARASFAAGAIGGLFLVLLEGLFRRLVELGRFELVATFVPAIALLIVAAAMIVEVALLGRAACDREGAWWAAATALLTKRAITWIAAMATILFLPGLIFAAGPLTQVAGVLAWLAAGAFGVFVGRNLAPRLLGTRAGWVLWLASVAAGLFFAGLVAATALFVSLLANMPALYAPGGDEFGPFTYYLEGVLGSSILTLLTIAIGFGIVYGLARRLIDVNLFSLDALDAGTLIPVYLGASRPMPAWRRRWSPPRDQRESAGAPSMADPAREPGLPLRDPDPLTGIDSGDDLELGALCIGKKTDHDRVYWGPHLLFNTTRKNTAEPGEVSRQALDGESFFLSPLYCGCPSTGYARTENSRPAGAFGPNLSLGRAMAISGAAGDVRPGSLPPGPLTALLTLFSARPGSWIEKPKPEGWAEASPTYADLPLSAAFGLTGGGGDFLYLAGGEEFESLGVYELIRRRCRYIIAVDAGDGARDGDVAPEAGLATLIRRCLCDFGIRIEIASPRLPEAGGDRLENASAVIARVHYGDVDQGAKPGAVIYVRLASTGDDLPELAQFGQYERASTHRSSRSVRELGDRRHEGYRWLGNQAARAVFGDTVMRLAEQSSDRPEEIAYAPRLFAAVVKRWTGELTGQLDA